MAQQTNTFDPRRAPATMQQMDQDAADLTTLKGLQAQLKTRLQQLGPQEAQRRANAAGLKPARNVNSTTTADQIQGLQAALVALEDK